MSPFVSTRRSPRASSSGSSSLPHGEVGAPPRPPTVAPPPRGPWSLATFRTLFSSRTPLSATPTAPALYHATGTLTALASGRLLARIQGVHTAAALTPPTVVTPETPLVDDTGGVLRHPGGSLTLGSPDGRDGAGGLAAVATWAAYAVAVGRRAHWYTDPSTDDFLSVWRHAPGAPPRRVRGVVGPVSAVVWALDAGGHVHASAGRPLVPTGDGAGGGVGVGAGGQGGLFPKVPTLTVDPPPSNDAALAAAAPYIYTLYTPGRARRRSSSRPDARAGASPAGWEEYVLLPPPPPRGVRALARALMGGGPAGADGCAAPALRWTRVGGCPAWYSPSATCVTRVVATRVRGWEDLPPALRARAEAGMAALPGGMVEVGAERERRAGGGGCAVGSAAAAGGDDKEWWAGGISTSRAAAMAW
ncbi:hypothetical protein MMPV_006067 [Pyropia vietnamensis]